MKQTGKVEVVGLRPYPELKPCPFCGGEPELVDNRLSWYVSCTECEVTVIGDRVPEPERIEDVDDIDWRKLCLTACTKWNTRSTPQPEE